MGIKGKLRIGILLDSFNVPAWAYAMVERIAHSNYAEIVLIVLNESQNKPWNKNFLSRIFHAWRYLFYNAYLLLENFLFPLNPDAFEIKNIRSLVKHIPVIPVRPVQTAHFDCFSDRDIQKIKHFRTDVLIRLGFRILQGKILQTPLYGVWSYQHADNDVNGGGPAGFWEVIEKKPVTGSVLQMLTEDLDAGIVLYKSYASTDPLSVNRNRNHLYWKSLSFIPRKLEELHKQKDSFIKQHLQTSQNIHLYSNRLYAPPHNLKALQCILSLLFKYINYRCFNKFYFDQWILLFDIRKNISPSLWKYKKMIPPKDRFWADPFIFFQKRIVLHFH